jgi:hypothetical protein
MEASEMRPRLRAATVIALSLAGAYTFVPVATASTGARAAADEAASPLFQILGDWRFGRGRYRFTEEDGVVRGRARVSLDLGACTVRRGETVFRGFRFVGTSERTDVWRGRLALVREGCRRVLVPSTIRVTSDLRFTETSTLPGESSPQSSLFRRIRPPVRSSDPVVGTWVRNAAGIVVSAAGDHYEGRAREAFLISNGCTVPAGTLIWTMRPTAPRRYQGTLPTFLKPPGCEPGPRNRSAWRLTSATQLLRQSPDGNVYAYQRG